MARKPFAPLFSILFTLPAVAEIIRLCLKQRTADCDQISRRRCIQSLMRQMPASVPAAGRSRPGRLSTLSPLSFQGSETSLRPARPVHRQIVECQWIRSASIFVRRGISHFLPPLSFFPRPEGFSPILPEVRHRDGRIRLQPCMTAFRFTASPYRPPYRPDQPSPAPSPDNSPSPEYPRSCGTRDIGRQPCR